MVIIIVIARRTVCDKRDKTHQERTERQPRKKKMSDASEAHPLPLEDCAVTASDCPKTHLSNTSGVNMSRESPREREERKMEMV